MTGSVAPSGKESEHLIEPGDDAPPATAATAPRPRARCGHYWRQWSRRKRAAVVGTGVVVGLGVAIGLYFAIAYALFHRYPVHTYASGLVLSGNTSLALHNVDMLMQGDLVVQDTASLTLTNGAITLDTSRGPNTVVIRVLGSGRVVLDNVALRQPYRAPCRIANSVIADNAHVTFTHVVRACNWFMVDGTATYQSSYGNTGLTLLQAFAGTVSIAHEPQVWLELYLSPGAHTVANVPLAGAALSSTSGFFASVLASSWPGATVSIADCGVQQMDLGVLNGVNLTVTDSPAVSLGWSLGLAADDLAVAAAPIVLDGLLAGTYADRTWVAAASSVRLVNSGLKRLWGSYWAGTRLTFNRCDLQDIAVMDSAAVDITDSTLDQLGLIDSASSTLTGVELRRLVTGVVAVHDSATLTVSNSPQVTPALVVITDQGRAIWT